MALDAALVDSSGSFQNIQNRFCLTASNNLIAKLEILSLHAQLSGSTVAASTKHPEIQVR